MLINRKFDYEDAILDKQEQEYDECKGCKFASVELCKNQCTQITEHFNPAIMAMLGR